MKDKTIKIDLSKIANTALQEKVDKELEKVLDNILDPNTEAKATRKVTITLTMSTDDERTVVKTGMEVKSTLAPQKGVATTVIVGRDDTGKIHANELKSGIPGQTYFDDNGDMRTDTGELVEEVEQPASQFVFRVNKSANLALFEADGGKWKLDAVKNISDYLKTELANNDKITILA